MIGASIAYFLSRRGVAATVIERVRLASAASGKAGGFLVRDWCDGTPLEPLARRALLCMPNWRRNSGAIGATVASPPMAVSPAIEADFARAAIPIRSIGCRRT